jgi:hypothetical protein
MRKIVLALALVSLFLIDTNVATAQAYEKGSKVLNVGAALFEGFGVTGSFEVGIWPTGDFGVIGLGGAAAIQFVPYAGLSESYTKLSFGPRATYHFTIIPVENMDVYAVIQPTISIYGDEFISDRFYPGLNAGIRYYFSETFGIWGEVGYDHASLKGGVAFKF